MDGRRNLLFRMDKVLNSNSLAFGAPFLTYLLLESESESENSAYTSELEAEKWQSSNLLAIIEFKCNCAIALKFVYGLGLKYRDLRQGGLSIVEIYVLCFGQFPNTWPSQQWIDPPLSLIHISEPTRPY